MWTRFKNLILFGDTDEKNFDAVRDKIQNYNCYISLCFASVAALLISVMIFLSFKQEGFINSRPVYIYGLILSVIQIIVSRIALKHPILSYVSVYMAISIFLIYGIAIGTITRPEEQTVTFMVMLIFVPLIFVDRPINIACSLIFYIIMFIIMACKTKTGATLAVDLTDAVIFGILAIISETVSNSAKIKGYVLEHRLQIMSETDQLTGLKNRNCYEMRLPQYPTSYRASICCIYVDANGLHELNNTKGHKAGDDMLCYIGNTLLRQFGPYDVYRVGGDEFVVFIFDDSEESIHSAVDEIRATINERGYHAAIGYEHYDKKKVDINKLIVDAESKMYKDKAEFYKVRDRRSR